MSVPPTPLDIFRSECFDTLKPALDNPDRENLIYRLNTLFSQHHQSWKFSLSTLTPSQQSDFETLISWNKVPISTSSLSPPFPPFLSLTPFFPSLHFFFVGVDKVGIHSPP